MNDTVVIGRLRESKSRFDDEQHALGVESGHHWVRESGQYEEVMALERFIEEDWGSNLSYFEWPHREVAKAICGDEGEDDGVREFWEDVSGHSKPWPPFVRGFCVGALEEWSSLKTHV